MSSTTDWASDQGALESDAGNNSVNSDGGLTQAEMTFVEWAPNVDGAPRQAPPVRVYHRKSKTGCAECRARRVKVWPRHIFSSFLTQLSYLRASAMHLKRGKYLNGRKNEPIRVRLLDGRPS